MTSYKSICNYVLPISPRSHLTCPPSFERLSESRSLALHQSSVVFLYIVHGNFSADKIERSLDELILELELACLDFVNNGSIPEISLRRGII